MKLSSQINEFINFAILFFKERIMEDEPALNLKKIHIKIIELVLDPNERYINITGFRGSAKSTWASFIYVFFAIIIKKEPYTIIARETNDIAREAFDVFKEELETISESIKISVKTSGKMTLIITHQDDQKTSKIRFMSRESKIRGAQASKGKRPTLIVLDDMESYETVESKSERNRTSRIVFGDILKATDAKHSKVINVGNYIHGECLVAKFENDNRFVTLKIPALVDGKSQWEERFPTESLIQEYETYQKNGMGNIWLMEMMCQIVDEENAIFKRADFQYIDYDEAVAKSVMIYTESDLAIKQSETADRTAYVTCGIGEDNSIYVLDINAGRWSAKSDRLGRELYATYEKNKPLVIDIEDKAGSDGLLFVLDTLSRDFKFSLPINLIKASTERDAKFKRISSLQTLFVTHKIFFVSSLPYKIELEDELLTFPRGRHDDIIDALSFIQFRIFRKDFSAKSIKPRRRGLW